MAVWGPLIAAGASLLGGAMGADGAKDAGKAQSKSAAEQLAFQRWLYEQQVGRSEPWRATGHGALNQLAQMFGLPYSPYSAPDFGGSPGDQGILQKRFGGSSGWEDLKSGNIGGGGIGSHGRKATFAPGQGRAFSARQVSKMLKQGISLDEIDKMGKLELSLNPHRLKKLMNKRGLSGDQIQQLQYGADGPEGPQAPGVINPGDPGYQMWNASGGNSTPPGYNFFREEGQRDLGNSFAARGGAFSGNALKGLSQFNQNYANQNMVQPLMQLAGFGTQANSQAGSASNAYGAFGGNAIGNAGDARASGIAGSANMWGQAISGAAQGFGNYYGQQRNAYDDYIRAGQQGWG